MIQNGRKKIHLPFLAHFSKILYLESSYSVDTEKPDCLQYLKYRTQKFQEEGYE